MALNPESSPKPILNRSLVVASFPYVIIVLAILVRFLPHTANFTPVGAMLLLAGACLPARRFWFPLAAIIASDFILTRFVYHYPYSAEQYFVWLGWIAMLGLGWSLHGRERAWRIGFTTVAGSLSFFLISNFGVWLTGWYSHTLAGLEACYVAGLPFYRQAASGDLVFAAVFFGALAWLRHRAALEQQPAAV